MNSQEKHQTSGDKMDGQSSSRPLVHPSRLLSSRVHDYLLSVKRKFECQLDFPSFFPVTIGVGITSYVLVSLVLSVFVELATGWLRPFVCFYWGAIASRHKLDNSSSFVVVSMLTAIEILAQILIVSRTQSRMSWHLFHAFVSMLTPTILLPSIPISCSTMEAIQFCLFSFAIHIVTPFDPSWIRIWLLFASGVLGLIIARCTEVLIFSSSQLDFQMSSSAGVSQSPTTWKPRRHSSPRHLKRRTSFPNLDSSRCFSFSGNTGMIVSAEASLAEAHGIISDILNDLGLPPRAVTSLRAVASLLAPPTPTSSKAKNVGYSLTETAHRNSGETEEIPLLNERTSSVLSKKSKMGLPTTNLYRRMSTWSTTTTATGLPVLEPEPSKKRAVNFRPSGLPSPSNPSVPFPSGHPSHLANHLQNTSQGPLQSPKTSRSYSTTSLPFGMTQYGTSNQVTRKSPTRESVVEEEEANEVEEVEINVRDEVVSTDGDSGKVAALTSDYDSSNASPSCTASEEGNEGATVNSVTSAQSILLEGIELSGSHTTSLHDIKGPCLLCGRKRTRASFEAVQRAKDVWPNCDAPPPVVAKIDPFGRYLVKDGTAYDLEELAVDPLLNLISEWDYPIFDLKEAAGDTILSEMSYRIFFETGLFEAFKIPRQEFLNFFRSLECGYRNKPYHNRTHAADVIHGVYYLTSQPIPGFDQIPADSRESPLQKTSAGPLPQSYLRHISVCEETYGIMGANFPALELLALYTAAAMHDFDHPGRTNAFLVSTFAPQALLYNDRSVLENYHAATAWTLFFSDPEYNWLRSLDQAEFKRFRFLVVELILSTDLKRHFDILADFNAKVNDVSSPGIDWMSENDRLLVMQMSIKLADINGPCKKSDIHVEWTRRIAEEFYEQGDDENRLGMSISPFMDRRNPQLAKLQESFISHLVAPLCNSYAEAGLLPGLWQYLPRTCAEEEVFDETITDKPSIRRIVCLQTKHLQENYDMWLKEMEEQEKKQEPDTSCNTSGPNSSDDSSTPVLNAPIEELSESDGDD